MAPQYAAAFQSRLDAMPAAQRKALLEQWATDPSVPKSLNDFAEKRLESIERGEEPTNEQKNAEYDAENRGALTRHDIEACASSHYWSRELQTLGHTVRLYRQLM
jgi:hypothetical protein